ncbi:MAG: prepilin peptidase [Candidatus Uhrbacteria bacterium]|nr:prepilin peptidase [Candidatus Uhrbacteria bacterium]
MIKFFFVFVLGTVVGSFVNVLVIRLKDASSLWGRSHCPECHKRIRARHLVPIFSWLMLRGRCADCHKRIHSQYPLVELASGVLLVIALARHDFFLDPAQLNLFLFESLFTVNLLMLTTFDWRFRLLPMEWMIGSIVLFGAWNVLMGWMAWPLLVIGCCVGIAFLGIQVLVSRGRWMGLGDPWMAGLIGAVLGWPDIAISFYMTYLAGGALAIILFICGMAKRGTRIPFAPLLAFGAIITLWFGQTIQEWMTRVLF